MYKIKITYLTGDTLLTLACLAVSYEVAGNKININPAYDPTDQYGAYSLKDLAKNVSPIYLDRDDSDEFVYTLVVDGEYIIKKGEFTFSHKNDYEKAKEAYTKRALVAKSIQKAENNNTQFKGF
jgi:hypothetical protein